jgi:hypothetical protein
MKPQYRILLIAFLGTLAQMYLPWWTAVVVAFLVELIYGSRKFLSFLMGFYGVALPWMIGALITDLRNDSILSDRILVMFQLPTWPLLIIVVTGIVGGVAGGMAAWAGGHITELFLKDAKR